MALTPPLAIGSDTMYRLLVEGVVDYAIFMLSPEGIVANWNAGAERAKGYRAAEIIGQHFSRFYTEEDRHRGLPQRALAAAAAGGKFESEGWRLRQDGSRFWAHVVIDAIRDADGTLIAFAKVTRDLTAQKLQADDMRRMRENLDLALANMSQGLCLYDERERLVLCNDRLREMLDLDEARLAIGSTFTDLLWEIHADPQAEGEEVAATVQRIRQEHLAKMAVPRARHAVEMTRQERVLSISHRGLPSGGWVSTVDDVTEHRVILEKVNRLAHQDVLTGLPNRLHFLEQLDGILGREETGADVLLFLDLDHFKAINEVQGQGIGDGLLQAVATRIRAQLRHRDLVARMGADDFAVLLREADQPADVAAFASRLIREIGRPVTVGDATVMVGVSIGIAWAASGEGADTLLRNADLALQRAKQSGRNCHRRYEPGMELVMQERRALKRDLRIALRDGQFALHFQPVVDTQRNTITSFEALLRWKSPSRGNVPPADFIPFAEEMGLMPEIGDWVLDAACRAAAGWVEPLRVAVNLSATQFRLPDLVSRVAQALARHGLPAERLELELTETAMVEDVAGARVILEQLRALGIQLAMDDFGTGYSSLSFLRALPFSRIKIDRSFVQDLGEKPESTAIVRAVAALCSSLGLAATAEGVETERQAAILRGEGCVELQGYLISKPRADSELAGWIADFNAAAGLAAPAA